MSETTLWTNSSLTSAFADQTITLSESIENYDYIKFVWVASTSYTNVNSTILVPINDLKKSIVSNNTCLVSLGVRQTSSNRVRYVIYTSTTQLRITTANIQGGSTVSTTDAIPYKVTGIKLH